MDQLEIEWRGEHIIKSWITEESHLDAQSAESLVILEILLGLEFCIGEEQLHGNGIGMVVVGRQ